MYVCLMDLNQWTYIPRDDVDVIESRVGLTVNRSGVYHLVTLCDASEMVTMRAVGRLLQMDPASDRMVLDSVGARACIDPPGGPWAVFSCADGSPVPSGQHALVASIMYGQIVSGSNRIPPS
jgi:hypothetical protein